MQIKRDKLSVDIKGVTLTPYKDAEVSSTGKSKLLFKSGWLDFNGLKYNLMIIAPNSDRDLKKGLTLPNDIGVE